MRLASPAVHQLIATITVLVVAAFSLSACGTLPGSSVSPATSPSTQEASSPSPTSSAGSKPSPSESAPAISTPTVDAATVVLATYGADGETIYASGIVPGLSEDSGTCTLTASGASGPVSASAPAHAAGGSVNCGRITVPVSVGTWSITLRYTSPDASGESAPTEVVIG